jgi:lysophospholipase L1-like esterase
VYVAANALRAQNYSVTLLSLGIPTAVISQRLQTLGEKYGRLILGNFINDEMPFVQRGATLVTVFAGGNDVEVITAALARGEGGSNPTAFIDQQIAAFREDYSTLLDGIRSRSPSAQIVLLNVPNLAGLPFLAGASLSERQTAQRLSVGITTTVLNPLTAQRARVLDLMCDPRLYQPAQLSSDGFHPNDAGYAILAAEVVRATTASAYAAPRSACPEMTAVPNL